jgi:hypothetical protein
MKKPFLTIAVLLGMLVSINAQQAVKIGPLGFLFGNYNLRYEKALSEKTSFQVGANFYDYDLGGFKTTGFGIDAGWRYYFKEAIKGAYIFPSANFDFNKTSIGSNTNEKGSFSNLNIGATIGYQWVAGGGFVTDLGLGYGTNIAVSSDDAFADSRDLGVGGSPRFTFAIGYSF